MIYVFDLISFDDFSAVRMSILLSILVSTRLH